MVSKNDIMKMIASRKALAPAGGFVMPKEMPAEGGCGVIGMASNQQIPARHMLRSLRQMRNRGNGKGGGIAAVGLVPEEFGVTQEILENDYLMAVAYLDESVRKELEENFVYSTFEVDHMREESHLEGYSQIEGLEVRPPEVVEYFVRVKDDVVDAYIQEHGLDGTSRRRVEDEIVYQNSYRLNTSYYQSTGEKKAFVLSHGKNLLVLKMVGYGGDVIAYYQLEDIHAHVWIGHHRYPTKGRVWHPGGAHPFIGLNEALVHNGDFANHASISEYLAQRNIYPLFLTDTEVAVQVFDLLHRTYDYPLEYVIEAMAPTTERDFTLLPSEKRGVYNLLQTTHMHCSPDGPWFFLIAQSDTHAEGGSAYRLTGITDTSMLRPQVFAWQENTLEDGSRVQIGLAASEKQGIDAALESLAESDNRFWPRADKFWNARGGSHTDGGAFLFTVKPGSNGSASLTVEDKFGAPIAVPTGTPAYIFNGRLKAASVEIPAGSSEQVFDWFTKQIVNWDYPDVVAFLSGLEARAEQSKDWVTTVELLAMLIDRRYHTGGMRRSSLLAMFDASLLRLVELLRDDPGADCIYHAYGAALPEMSTGNKPVLLDADGFPQEGETSLAREIDRLFKAGFRHFIVVNIRGHRFIGSGLGPNTEGVRIDVFGSTGDYLASGLDGLEIHAHNNAQDQLAQIMKRGKLVVFGDVGQTFMYGAKGGEAYILGNAAGRPLINAVGKPRVVINGTCLDYLAESFMAGDPLNGGGFVVLNGLAFDETNQIVDLYTPYPGGNLFSLASGGAIYLRDPRGMVDDEQLNGGEFTPLTGRDWELIKPYLEENGRLFGIPVARLLTVNGEALHPSKVYRKIRPKAMRALQAEEAWVTKEEAG
jgi:glutamate synthase domain-containing protein 1/glutamate synthase domain-containing protein 3